MNGAEKTVSLSMNGAEKPVLLSINGVEEPLRKAAKLSGSGLWLFLESNVVSTQVLNVSLQLGTVPTLLRQNQTDIRSAGTGNGRDTQFSFFYYNGTIQTNLHSFGTDSFRFFHWKTIEKLKGKK